MAVGLQHGATALKLLEQADAGRRGVGDDEYRSIATVLEVCQQRIMHLSQVLESIDRARTITAGEALQKQALAREASRDFVEGLGEELACSVVDLGKGLSETLWPFHGVFKAVVQPVYDALSQTQPTSVYGATGCLGHDHGMPQGMPPRLGAAA
jgi:hypothetical protein